MGFSCLTRQPDPIQLLHEGGNGLGLNGTPLLLGAGLGFAAIPALPHIYNI